MFIISSQPLLLSSYAHVTAMIVRMRIDAGFLAQLAGARDCGNDVIEKWRCKVGGRS